MIPLLTTMSETNDKQKPSTSSPQDANHVRGAAAGARGGGGGFIEFDCIPFEDIEWGETLGSGSFGCVYKGNVTSSRRCANPFFCLLEPVPIPPCCVVGCLPARLPACLAEARRLLIRRATYRNVPRD